MTLLHPDQERTRSHDGPTIGLLTTFGIELAAPWYERKPYAFRVEWKVDAGSPFDKWFLTGAAHFDAEGKRVETWPFLPPGWVSLGDDVEFEVDLEVGGP